MALMLYMTPGSCSTGIHILLEELDLAFQATVLNLPAGDHRRSDYLAINPKGTIPALRLDDGEVLTEFPAIACWIARRWPQAGLLPDDPLQAARTLEWMDYIVGTVHGQGFTRIFTPESYLPEGIAEADRARWLQAIQARGHELVGQAFDLIEARLPAHGHVMGPRLTIADAALFYVLFWADKIALPMPPRCAAHLALMRARPAVQRVLREEGYR